MLSLVGCGVAIMADKTGCITARRNLGERPFFLQLTDMPLMTTLIVTCAFPCCGHKTSLKFAFDGKYTTSAPL